MTIHLHEGDLPAGLDLGAVIAVDTETMGLEPHRDRLCLVQLSAGDGDAHLVRMARGARPFSAPRLASLMAASDRLKIFHFARFDVAVLKHWLDVDCAPIYCTKIASRLARTYTDRHGLADLTRELLGIELSKAQQSSDWGGEELTEAQLEYAAADVLHLHALRERLDDMLAREGREVLAQACFDFLPQRAALDLGGWREIDIFAH
ncbi:MAG: ribonuclease H-like domain-containing protein [Alphaproteobacteria bacterium]|nr:ribonuclease H-like domain-containing protein [Alphaproteobacteria bacterium]